MLAYILVFNFVIPIYGASNNLCGLPEVPENGHIVFHNSGQLVAGVSVSYKCDVGFILVGPEQRVCEASGFWSEHSPVCAINVALYKPSSQSSTLYIDSVAHYANFSTDGNFDGICSSTRWIEQQETDAKKRPQKSSNWWRVDLLESYRIYAVELLMPASVFSTPSTVENSSKRDVNQIEIYASMDDNAGDESSEESNAICYKHRGKLETNQLHTFVCQKELQARYIRIVSKSNAPLQLCEVVVLSTSATSDWQCGSISSMDSWGVFGGKCFYGSTEPMPWFSASTHCQMNGASLVSEMDESTHKFLIGQAKHRTTKNAQHYWLGLVMGSNREWTWINGKPSKSEFWANSKSRDISVTNMAYAAAMAQPVAWNWVPAVQTLWYNWICQSKPRFCSGPGIPQNGGVMLSTQMYTIGASSYYYCNYGYVLKGAESRTCLDNGTWSGRVPKCVVDCGRLDVPLGVIMKYVNDSTLAGSKVEYRCPTGQKIIGTTIRACQPDGTWSDHTPKCVDMDCGWPPDITNGHVYLSDNSTKVGSVSEFTCNMGYGLIGPPVRHCAPSGQWMPTQTPYCYDINTVHAPLPQATGESWHHSSLMTGFVVAVVVLLLVIIVVLIWTWRKKKAYDGLSMTTLYAAAANSSASSAGHQAEVLYAFPTGSVSHSAYNRTNSPNTDGASNYYVPSSLNASHETNSTKGSAPVAATVCQRRKLSFLSADDLCLDSPKFSNQHQLFMANRIPLSIGQQFILAPTANGGILENPILLAPVHHDQQRQMEKIVNDIHLTLPARRRKLISASHYQTVHQQSANTETASKSIRSGAKTMGAAAGRLLTKVRRKLSEANFNLLHATNAGTQMADRRRESTASAIEAGHSPTLRISLAEIVQQLNEANANRLKAAFNPDVERSPSPTASELFAFDDDDGDEEAAYSNPTSSRRSSEGHNSVREEEDSKIYDLPPDASALIYDNLAKALLKQSCQNTQENIYETPTDADDSKSIQIIGDTNKKQAIKLEQVGIEIVHTYC